MFIGKSLFSTDNIRVRFPIHDVCDYSAVPADYVQPVPEKDVERALQLFNINAEKRRNVSLS
jgi:hypothetical protein